MKSSIGQKFKFELLSDMRSFEAQFGEISLNLIANFHRFEYPASRGFFSPLAGHALRSTEAQMNSYDFIKQKCAYMYFLF